MDQVQALEAELNKVIEEHGPPIDAESLLRPGAIIRLHENDNAPRYLGPSSGVAITKLVMEEAKKYMDTRSISDLMPEVRERKPPPPPWRPGLAGRKQSYPMISAVPAKELPTRPVADNLVRVFNEKGEWFCFLFQRHETKHVCSPSIVAYLTRAFFCKRSRRCL